MLRPSSAKTRAAATKSSATRSPSAQGKRRLKARFKPAWDSTMSDLASLKLTPEELNRRKVAHRSQNLDLVKEEKEKQHVAKIRSKDRQSGPSSRGQVALLREILASNDHFYDALENSDRLLASVRDLLGVDPKKHQGVPYVTKAPHHSASDRSLPEADDVRSQLDVNSESVMDKSALNDDQHEPSESSSDPEEQSDTGSYQPAMDLSHFRQLIREAEKERLVSQERPRVKGATKSSASNVKHNESRRTQLSRAACSRQRPMSAVNFVTSDSGHDSVAMDVPPAQETPVSSPRAAAAMNDTGKVKRLRPFTADARTRRDLSDQFTAAAAAAAPTMDDFHRILDVVQSSLAEYEKLTGRRNDDEVIASASPKSYSGYTTALLEAVAKMSVYVKETEVRWRAESIVNEHLASDVLQLRNLVDALTTDLIALQDEYARLSNDFVKHRRDTEQQIHMFTRALASCGVTVEQQPAAVMLPPGAMHNSHAEQMSANMSVQSSRSNAGAGYRPSAAVVSEAEFTQSRPTADLNTSSYQLVTNCQPPHPVMSGTYLPSYDVRRASATAGMSPGANEAVTELALGKSNLDVRRDAIRQQMVELNRQRLLAQAKVDELRLQEQQFTQQPFGKVSPSVSPITVASEQLTAAFTMQHAPEHHLPNPSAESQGHVGAVRHIVVSVPHTVSDNGVPHQFRLTDAGH